MSFRASPRGSSDSVHVGIGLIRQVIVDDEVDAFDVDSSGGNVGGDEHADLPFSKTLQRADSSGLGFVAVNSCGGHALFGEMLGNAIGDVFHSGENQGEAFFVIPKNIGEQVPLVGLGDVTDTLINLFNRRGRGGYFDVFRLSQDRASQLDDGIGHGRGEEERLSFRGEFCDDLANVVNESHVEHAVGFINDKNFE